MRIHVYIIFVLFFLYNCKNYKNVTQQSSCGNEFEIQYDKSGKYLLSQSEKDKNYFIIYFESSFNDKIRIDINQKEIFNKNVITNDRKPDDYSDMLTYKMDNSKEFIFNVKGENSKTCLKLPLNKNYRIIYLFYYQDKWIVRFSNNLRIN